MSWEQNPWDEPLAKAWERGWGDVRVYLQGLADSRKCYEAKLVLVGEGNVGKTSLVAALRDESFVENRSTTHGIEVRSFQVDHPDEVEQDLQITLNSWDFGGQRVYRITHQFFFSPRSLFLVVWWPREGVEQNDVEGWIERIQLRVGDQARVLVVATHTDEHSRVPRINKEGLKRRFGEMIVGFHAVDSREMHNIDQLRTVIAQAASQLPQMGEPLPAAWQRIREDINKREDVQIPFEKFRELCAQENLKDDAVRALSNLMNDLGDVVYFSESEGLAEHMVLNPEWLTRAIGYVLEDKPTNDAAGVLAWSRLHEVWSSNRPDREDYEAWAHPFFLRLMEQFDISYRLGNETSLVSQLVPTDEPAEVQTWRDAGDGTELTLVCRLSSEATGLIPWLIVRTHWYSQRIHWQGGMLLNHPPHGEALIELTGRNLRITVRARFPTYLMDILKDTVNFLMEDRWPGLKHRWAVQCVTDDCPSLLNVEALLSRRKEGRQNTNCSECGHDLDIDVLLRWAPPESPDLAGEVKTVVEIETADDAERKQSLPTRAAWITRCFHKLYPGSHGLFSFSAIDDSTWQYRAWCEAPECEHPNGAIDGSGPGSERFEHAPSAFMNSDTPDLIEVLRICQAWQQADLPPELVLFLDGIDSELREMRAWNRPAKPGRLPRAEGPKETAIGLESGVLTLSGESLRGRLEYTSGAEGWGLRPVTAPDGQKLWVCSEHRKRFDPGLPVIPEPEPTDETSTPTRRFTLESVRIRDFRGIESLDVMLTAESDLTGTWTCLAGINGAGKTAILEAIALALLGPDHVMELGGGRLAQMIRKQTGITQAEVFLTVTREDSEESATLYLPLELESDGNARINHELIEHNESENAEDVRRQLRRHLFASYGATRNVVDEAELPRAPSDLVARQWSLFQPLSPIPGMDGLLSGEQGQAALKTVRLLLNELPEFEGIVIDEADSKGLALQLGGCQLESSEWPDGYRSTVAWLADLCSEWHRLKPDAAATNDFEQMSGVVLIDEIDLHLHPSLQRSLVPKLRRLLPNVQFIVTTHSPMVLASFDCNELVLLEQDEEKLGIRRLDRQIFGFSMNQIYRWLLDTSSRSPVIDELIADGEDEEVVRHLYLSGDEDEEPLDEEEQAPERPFNEQQEAIWKRRNVSDGE